MQSEFKALKRYATPEQMPVYYPYVKKGGVRAWIFNAKHNGFFECIKRIGRKILIDLDKFEAWIDSQNQGGKQ